MKGATVFAVLFLVLTASIFVAVGIWDVVNVNRGNPDQTVSSILREWSGSYPILPCLFGFVVGLLFAHLFWPAYPPAR